MRRYAAEKLTLLEAQGKLTRGSRFRKWRPLTLEEMPCNHYQHGGHKGARNQRLLEDIVGVPDSILPTCYGTGSF